MRQASDWLNRLISIAIGVYFEMLHEKLEYLCGLMHPSIQRKGASLIPFDTSLKYGLREQPRHLSL